MSIVITGATGKLGGHVVESLLQRGIDPSRIVATGRNPERLDELGARGIETVPVDHNEIDSIRPALVGADELLLISGSEFGARVPQHRNVVTAARDAGVGYVAYTSIPRANTSSLLLAADHKATEELIIQSGFEHTFLRNGWYMENYTAQLSHYLDSGTIVGSAGDGRVSAATRADFAEAAAAVLADDAHRGAVFELGGDSSFTMNELAQTLSRVSGTPVTYQDLAGEDYVGLLADSGLPKAVAEIIADGDRGVADGELFVDSGDLSRLIGRPTATLEDAISATLDSAAV